VRVAFKGGNTKILPSRRRVAANTAMRGRSNSEQTEELPESPRNERDVENALDVETRVTSRDPSYEVM